MIQIFQGLELFLNVFDIFIFYRGAEILFTPTVKRKKVEILFIALLFFTLKTVLDWKNILTLISTIIFLFVFCLFILYLFLSYMEKVKYKLLYTLAYYVIMSISELIVIAIFLLFTNHQLIYFQINLPSKTSALVLSRILMILIFIFINGKIQKDTIAHHEIYQMLLVIFSINFTLIFITFILYNNIDYLTKDFSFLVILISIFLMTVLSIVIGKKFFIISEKNYEDSLQLQYMKAQKKHNEEMKIITQNLRHLRHDMNNHLAVLSGLCDTKQYGELNKYLSELIGNMEAANDIVIIPNNKILSVIINNKKSLAQEKQISFSYNISSGSLSLSDMELCSLFGNIIDNAIEANELLLPEKRWIDLSIKENQDGWIILCKNPFKEKPVFYNKNFISTKNEPDNHGIGTKTMRRIIEQHGGAIDYHFQENQFFLAIFLPKEKELKK